MQVSLSQRVMKLLVCEAAALIEADYRVVYGVAVEKSYKHQLLEYVSLIN